MSKKPSNYRWSKFFWDDWGNDYKLQSCSAATQGIWINLLTLMFKSERPGYLQMNGRAMTILEIASFFKFDKRTIEKNLKILIEKGVCSVDENNVVFSRRMAREEQERLEQVQRTNAQDKCSKSSKDLQEPYRKVPVNLREEISENRQKSKVAYTEADTELESKKDSPQTPHSSKLPKVVPINETTRLFTESVHVLQERLRSSELECHKLVGKWFKQSEQDAPLVVEAIQAGLHGNSPVAYISAILKSRIEKRDHPQPFQTLQSYSKTNKEKITEEWGLCKNILEYQQKYSEEEPTLEQLQAYSPKRAWGRR